MQLNIQVECYVNLQTPLLLRFSRTASTAASQSAGESLDSTSGIACCTSGRVRQITCWIAFSIASVGRSWVRDIGFSGRVQVKGWCSSRSRRKEEGCRARRRSPAASHRLPSKGVDVCLPGRLARARRGRDMRVKRRSRNRKVVRFYATCFGFREPYKVLVDGTFVHHLLLHRLLPADDALRDLLSASRSPPLFTSKCVLAELRRLGKSHAEAFDAGQLLATARCEHDKVVSAVDCILSLIGDKNPEHYFVATQDADLRAKLREVPGVPVIYGLKNSLFFEQPSVQQRKFAQLDEEKRLHMDKSEYKKLLNVVSEGNTADDENGSHEEQNKRPASSLVENALGVAEKSKFKRKRAKGPNPLSCKKKKPKAQLSAAQNQGPKLDGEAKRKRVRKRKRSRKDNKQSEIES